MSKDCWPSGFWSLKYDPDDRATSPFYPLWLECEEQEKRHMIIRDEAKRQLQSADTDEKRAMYERVIKARRIKVAHFRAIMRLLDIAGDPRIFAGLGRYEREHLEQERELDLEETERWRAWEKADAHHAIAEDADAEDEEA
jgi:hypothetical protein